MNANELTPIQNQVSDALARKGWHVNSVRDCGEDEATVFMSKRIKSYSTRYAEVDARGLVNGVSLTEFLGSETSTQP
jgi:hypothetical protein